MNPASTITAVIAAAASRHETPVDPLTLLDTRFFALDGYLRAKLNAVITYHLKQNHGLHFKLIARAYRINCRTAEYRFTTGKHLVKKYPWKETYNKLP